MVRKRSDILNKPAAESTKKLKKTSMDKIFDNNQKKPTLGYFQAFFSQNEISLKNPALSVSYSPHPNFMCNSSKILKRVLEKTWLLISLMEPFFARRGSKNALNLARFFNSYRILSNYPPVFSVNLKSVKIWRYFLQYVLCN